MVLQTPGDQVDDLPIPLQPPLHTEEPGGKQLPPLPLGEIPPDDDVDRAGLVLEGDEGHPACGAGALAVGDDPGDPYLLAV